MVLCCDADLKRGRFFSLQLGLLTLIAACYTPFAIGQQVGVSLKLFGVTIPNNSIVDIDDVLYRAPIDGFREDPTNNNSELHDQALLCITDLEDCCDAPHTVHGDWYYPDGNIVTFDPSTSVAYRSNRGPNEVINCRQFLGSVRLFRRYSRPPERGRFRCELPSAADPNITQTLYVNIVDFENPVTISSSGPAIAGESFSLTCSATLVSPIPLPANVPSPSFEWFFGPNSHFSLPSVVTHVETALDGSYKIYESTLQFSSLNQSHSGTYTCKLGGGRLASSSTVSVYFGVVDIITSYSGSPMLGQSNYTLTCRVIATDSLCPTIITYQWTKNNGTLVQLETEINTLLFSPLRLSDAGQYTCQATISTYYQSNDITVHVMGSQDIKLQIPPPTSVILSSSTPNPVRPVGSTVNLTCTVHVELSAAVDVPVTVNVIWFVLARHTSYVTTNTSQPFIRGITTYNSTLTISSLGRDQSGFYDCEALLSSKLYNTYIITGYRYSIGLTEITTGVYLTLKNQSIANNTQVNIRNIGLSSDNPDSSLQCVTDRWHYRYYYGEWYWPNATMIDSHTSTTTYYSSRGDNGEVILNLPYNVTSPTGQFCCVVLDADYNFIIQTLCVIIDVVSITPFEGSPIAGENYTLECSTGGTVAAFEWLGPDNRTSVLNSSFIAISSNSSTSQLQFHPLRQSHNGSYSCHATTDEETLSSVPIEITVNSPKISIQISESTGSNGNIILIAGEDYDLICSILGAENLNPILTYQWRKNSDSSRIGTNSNTLSLTPARISDAEKEYSCSVTIASSYLSGNIAAVESHTVRIQIPPSSIVLTSSKADFIQIIGSDITLTCALKLSSSILDSEIFLLKVDVQLFRNGDSLSVFGPIVNGTTFIYTTQLNPFQRSDYGSYNCTATIRLKPPSIHLTGFEVLSNTLTIIPALPPPVDVRATQSSSSAPVEISWSPPTDGDVSITGYRIIFESGQNLSVPRGATSIGIRVTRSYVNESVFLRSEADGLFSEHINVSVERAQDDQYSTCVVETYSPNDLQRSEVGAAVGVAILVMCLVIVVITVIVTSCWCRLKKLSGISNMPISENLAYGNVNLMPEGQEKEDYENPGMIVTSTDGHSLGDNETTAGNIIYETISCASQLATEMPENFETNNNERATTSD